MTKINIASDMKECSRVSFITSDKLMLNGLWYGSIGANTGLIFIHGLSSSVFSHNDLMPLRKEVAAFYFNNRGHDIVAGIKRLDDSTKKGYDQLLAGAAHEVFSECIFDIQAAVDLLKNKGTKNIYLVGHSTGCQKTVYYLSKLKDQTSVKGVVLLCPISDYAAALQNTESSKLETATKYSKRLVDEGKPESLLPSEIWPELLDARRFLSLYTAESEEEIFSYAQPNKTPKALLKLQIPTLVLLAEQDEYADRPAADISNWFINNFAKTVEVEVINGAPHNLAGSEENIKKIMSRWLDSNKNV